MDPAREHLPRTRGTDEAERLQFLFQPGLPERHRSKSPMVMALCE